MLGPPVSVTAAEGLVRCLIHEGVDTAFGVASGYLGVFLDALRRGGIRVVTSLHESAAGFAAAGYTMASGKPGVIYAQSGPGVTNALTGMASAFSDSVPMMLVAAQTPTKLYGRDGHQEASGATLCVDQLDMFRTAAIGCFRPPTAETMISCARRALAGMHAHQSTAVLEVAADLWQHKVKFQDLPPEMYRATSTPIDVQGIERLAKLLREAKAPALLVGNRVVHRGAAADLVALCEEQELPCATVDYAKGAMPEDHPLALGVLGSCGHASATTYLQQADLVIVMGTRMSSHTSLDFDASLFGNLVHIDEVPEEPGRNFPLQLGIVSNLPATIRALRSACGVPIRRGSAERVRRLREEHNVYGAPKDRAPTTTPMIVHALRGALPRNTLVTGDSGLTLRYLKHFFPIYAPDGFFGLYGMAAMGSGLPLAVGVQAARPDDVVLCVIGDGGALVHLSELAVAAHYKLPLIVVVCDNGGYKQVGDRMERYHNEAYACALPSVDYAAVARACGCDGYVAEDAEGVAAAARIAVARRKPSLIWVRVNGDNLFDMTPEQTLKWWDEMFKIEAPSTAWPFPPK